MRSDEWYERLIRLRGRGLSPAVAEDLNNAGDAGMLDTLEAASDEDLAALSDLYKQRQHVHRMAADVTARLQEARRCGRLCCPINGPHDRTHPLCMVGPLLWDGDQA